MSVEAISWALNLAPVPRDRGGKRNPACKAVLVGLANHAGPDGTEAFPSVRTLVRYTDLSERTVRTALDRLAAGGIIRPCDPAVVAAKIKRADQRPQGWDLAMDLVRDDLEAEDLAVLERQFPGLTARVTLAAPEDSTQSDDEVQSLHPAAGTPVDHGTDGVQRLHLVPGTGCNHRSHGVQPPQGRGAAVAPEPSLEPPIEPPAANANARDTNLLPGNGRPISGGGAKEFFAHLGPDWPLTGRQRHRLAPVLASALTAGWEPALLAAFVAANTAGIRNPAAVLAARLSPAELPPPPARARARPPWCGQGDCDDRTRRLQRADGADAGRCPRCHPLAAGATGTSRPGITGLGLPRAANDAASQRQPGGRQS